MAEERKCDSCENQVTRHLVDADRYREDDPPHYCEACWKPPQTKEGLRRVFNTLYSSQLVPTGSDGIAMSQGLSDLLNELPVATEEELKELRENDA